MTADIEMIASSFGGGWACPLTDCGESALHGFFGEEPVELRPLCDRVGYIVEPWQGGDLVEHLRGEGVTWEQG